MTETIEYGPIGPFETSMIQAMMQGSGVNSALSFNLYRESIFVARTGERPIGFVCGHRGYGHTSHILVMAESYLHPAYERTTFQDEMEHCFVAWAAEKFGVTHLQQRRNSEIIRISDFINRPIKPLVSEVYEPEPVYEFDAELTPA